MQQFDAIIIGQGYAGLKAAQLGAQQGLKIAAVEAMFPGGLVMSINELSPAPEGESHCGPELTGELAMVNMDNGTHNVSAPADTVRAEGDGWVVEAGGETLRARNLVVATGATLRKLNVPGEAEFEGRGVSACADCDGPIFMGKEAAIIGGGDAAFQEAAALALYASKVTIVMRGATPRARAELVEAALANPAVTVLAETRVEEVIGTAADGVTALRIVDASGASRELPCSVVFAFIGLDPVTHMLPDSIARDASGAIIVDADLRAGAPGAWAIGAARSGFGGSLSNAAEDAAKVIAALS